MIDGILILRLAVNINELLNNELLLFPLPFDENGGEILNRTRTSEHRGLLFVLKNGNIKLRGSLHKYWNKGEHNYNDYFFTDIKKTIVELSKKFRIDTKNSILNNLEFGVNFQTTYNSAEVFRSVVDYKGTPFHTFSITGARGIECETDNFYIKFYDKGHQYEQPGNLLRFEIKVRKMRFFKDRGINIHSLATLLDYSEIIKLKDVIISVFNEILFTDYNINPTGITPANRLILSNGGNPNYWAHLHPNSNDFKDGNRDKEYISKRKKYYRERDKFKKLIAKYSTSTMKTDISQLIEKKCGQLLKIADKFTNQSTLPKVNESGQIHNSNIVGYCPTQEQGIRLCQSCGRDITNQRSGSKFCSAKYVGTENAHRCRNIDSNFRHRVIRMKERERIFPTLFDTSPYYIAVAI